MKKNIKNLIFVFCLLIFLYSGYQLVNIFLEYKAGTDAYEELASKVSTVKSDAELIPEVVEPETVSGEKYEIKEIISIDVDWSSYSKNEAVIGWIQVEGNDIINYPVVQSTDNDYYLTHLPDGTANGAGSIFVDYRNEGFGNRHVILYGHNMKNGSMFSSIKKYQNQEYADEHRYVYIATPDGRTRVFYVYSCHLTDALGESDGFNAYQVSFDGDEWHEWISKTQEKSLISSEIEIPEKCNIITLSTCMSRGVETERCVIHAVEVSNQEYVEAE